MSKTLSGHDIVEPYGQLEASKLVIEETKTPGVKPPHETLVFGHTFTDHMLEVDWTRAGGWGVPHICPVHPFSLHPAASVLHYAVEVFEGMKAYVDGKGRVRTFRPMENMKRMNRSNSRLLLPTFKEEELLECLKKLVLLDASWIPNARGYSLYIRPSCISTESSLGVHIPNAAKLFVILCPVGPYYKEGFSAVRLYADEKNVRAWPGGCGNSKLGSNYGPTILPQVEAAKLGCASVLWLTGDDKYVSEVGTMNFFVLWKEKKTGKVELITAPLEDGTILPGIVRDSILQLTRSWNEFEVSERNYTMDELRDAVLEGRVLESFGSGTAAIVSPVKSILYNGVELAVPLDPEDPESQAGKVTSRLMKEIMDIQYGKVEHEWSVIIE